MTCRSVPTPHGVAIVCDRGRRRPRRCSCCHDRDRDADLRCDWIVDRTAGEWKRCSVWICAQCAGDEVAPNKHLCVIHQAAYRAWLNERRNNA